MNSNWLLAIEGPAQDFESVLFVGAVPTAVDDSPSPLLLGESAVAEGLLDASALVPPPPVVPVANVGRVLVVGLADVVEHSHAGVYGPLDQL